MGSPAPRGSLNFFEEIVPPPLELLVEEGHVLGGVFVKVGIADGFGLDFAKAIEVELSGEGAEFVVVEVLRDDGGCE